MPHNDVLDQLATALRRCKASLAWYATNAEGNSPENPDPDDVEGVALADQALAAFAAYQATAAPQWSAADSSAATAEGWDVFDNSDRGLEIERIDVPEDATGNLLPPAFESDHDAIAHVYCKAQEGSSLHQKALYVTLLVMKDFDVTFGADMRQAPAIVPVERREGESERLRDLCERAGIELGYERDQGSDQERWSWGDEHGNTHSGFDNERDAALSGLDAKFGESWRFDVGNGDTRRSFLDFIESSLEQIEDEQRGVTP